MEGLPVKIKGAIMFATLEIIVFLLGFLMFVGVVVPKHDKKGVSACKK